MIISRCKEICSIERIYIEYFSIMLMESLDQTSLRKIPLLKSEIRTNRAKIIRVYTEFDSINCVFMSS